MGAAQTRKIAIEILFQAEAHDSYINLALNNRLGKENLPKRERAFISQLVYTTSRQQGSIDRLIKQNLKGKFQDLPGPIRAILRLAIGEILYASTPKEVAVNEAVELAKIFGHKGTTRLVNGLLRNTLRQGAKLQLPSLETDPVEHIAGTYSHPNWLVQRWIERFGVQFTMELCEANNQPASVTIRTNTLKITRDDLAQSLANHQIAVQYCKYSPDGLHIKDFSSIDQLEEFHKGYFTVQDESSMLVAPALAPQPGELIIDLCSAPGGKTSHLAALMSNRGKIVASDIHTHKLELVQQTCQRLGIHIVEIAPMDVRQILEKRPDLIGQAHGVLVDAPCSGLGVLRRRPDARWRKNPQEISQLTQIQRQILASAIPLLRPKGRLVYSTCSFEQEETLNNVQWLMNNFPVQQRNMAKTFPNIPSTEPHITLFPHIHGTDGFFLASFSLI